MLLIHIIVLAIIQGLTEFLPVSSSGHLVLAHEFLGSNGWQQDLTLDIAVHVGTLFAVLLYFRKDVQHIFLSFVGNEDKTSKEGRRLGLYILISSIPVLVAGYGLHLWQPEALRSVTVIGWAFIIFGLLLWVLDKKCKTDKSITDMNIKGALIIGLAQILALIPGTSRSGITMTAARGLGISRVEAARYSLLLAVIAISGAGLLGSLSLIDEGNAQLGLSAAIGAVLAFITSWGAIVVMMKWLEKATFTPFVIYRVLFGIALLGLVYADIL